MTVQERRTVKWNCSTLSLTADEPVRDLDSVKRQVEGLFSKLEASIDGKETGTAAR